LSAKDEISSDKKVALYVPARVIHSLTQEFGIQQGDIDNFVTLLLERSVTEHIAESNSKLFTESQTKEIEEDLKGLGYI
jgi:hypothetical protein